MEYEYPRAAARALKRAASAEFTQGDFSFTWHDRGLSAFGAFQLVLVPIYGTTAWPALTVRFVPSFASGAELRAASDVPVYLFGVREYAWFPVVYVRDFSVEEAKAAPISQTHPGAHRSAILLSVDEFTNYIYDDEAAVINRAGGASVRRRCLTQPLAFGALPIITTAVLGDDSQEEPYPEEPTETMPGLIEKECSTATVTPTENGYAETDVLAEGTVAAEEAFSEFAVVASEEDHVSPEQEYAWPVADSFEHERFSEYIEGLLETRLRELEDGYNRRLERIENYMDLSW
jgi:hypothetical protein